MVFTTTIKIINNILILNASNVRYILLLFKMVVYYLNFHKP
jgi:hypothetical protein